ncbi:WD40 repeat domain-containing protein [Streptosporangium sp. NPDC000396]|uniref:WD40 repeat domain-containing protein n=1 Tax=Streptosporangium sp. NPDC000396 TaxID=3366185 RepID=UPI00367E6327
MAATVVDGRLVAVTSAHDETVRVWDATTGQQVGEPLTDHYPVRAVATAVVEGRPIVVIGSDTNTARIVDLATDRQIGEPLRGHTDAVCTVALGTVDGRPVAVTGSWDATVRVWDAVTGEQVGEELVFPATVNAVAVAPDGRLAVAFGTELAVLTSR